MKEFENKLQIVKLENARKIFENNKEIEKHYNKLIKIFIFTLFLLFTFILFKKVGLI
jgi:hypothetical protein